MEEGGSQEIKVWEAGELEGSDPLSPPYPPQKKKLLNNSLIECD